MNTTSRVHPLSTGSASKHVNLFDETTTTTTKTVSYFPLVGFFVSCNVELRLVGVKGGRGGLLN